MNLNAVRLEHQRQSIERWMRVNLKAKRQKDGEQKPRRAGDDADLTEEEMKRFAEAEDTEKEMQQMLRVIEEKIKDPETGAEQRKVLQKNAEMLNQMLEEARRGNLDRRKWRELAQADEMQGMLKALATGEPIPDSQWNRLLSTLDTGLWQVRGRTPPEDFRKTIEQYQDQIRRLLNTENVDAN